MRPAKYALGTITVILLIIGVYLEVTDASVSGQYVGRYGSWHHYSDTAGSVFFYAALMAALLVLLIWLDRKDK